MKAKLRPLKGKYYGTEIEIHFDNTSMEVIKLWDSGNFEPSVRYLEQCGFTKEDWDNNILLESEWGSCHIRDMDLICDSHFESETTYNRALEIIRRINQELSTPPYI